MNNLPKRKIIRLPAYDYSREATYFVTICAWHKEYIFGEIVNDEMKLNDLGNIANDEWIKTPIIRPNVILDDFVIMPNHIHMIFEINRRTGVLHTPVDESLDAGSVQTMGRIQYAPTAEFKSPSQTVGAIIRGYKSTVTKQINKIIPIPVWQRNYYEHIIRDDNDLNRIREYIQNNPKNWRNDRNNPNGRP